MSLNRPTNKVSDRVLYNVKTNNFDKTRVTLFREGYLDHQCLCVDRDGQYWLNVAHEFSHVYSGSDVHIRWNNFRKVWEVTRESWAPNVRFKDEYLKQIDDIQLHLGSTYPNPVFEKAVIVSEATILERQEKERKKKSFRLFACFSN